MTECTCKLGPENVTYSMSWKQFYFCFILFRSDFFERVERVLQGLIEENCPVNSRTIRIFMSSTFTGNVWSWGEPPIMSYMVRLRPKRVKDFTNWGIWKDLEIPKKGPLINILWADAAYGCITGSFNLLRTTWKLQKDLLLWGFINNTGHLQQFVKGIHFFQ